MKLIPLTHSKMTLIALVDDADYDRLAQWEWRAVYKGQTWYAFRKEGGRACRRTIYMHTEIMQPSEDMKVDHRDGNGLNNQRHNLRECTHAQNAQNQRLSKASSTGYKGVTWDRRKNKFRAQITFEGRNIYLGLFNSPVKAARAYDFKARELFGEFAKLNFPEFAP